MNYDFDIWYKTNDPVFSDINRNSRIPEKWIAFEKVINGKYKDSFIKPINRYVEVLYPPPTLIGIDGDIVRLRQGNHAEFFLLEKGDNFFNIDRPWMRQYYNTEKQIKSPNDCFDKTFIFYTPWIIDADVKVSFERPEGFSPFYIYPKTILKNKIDKNIEYLEPDFIQFHFKKEGDHMDRPGYGKIKRQSAMYDIVFKADGIMKERVKEFYEQN